MLFHDAILFVLLSSSFHKPDVQTSRGYSNTSIFTVCHQINQEAWPVLLAALELRMFFSGDLTFASIPPQLQQNLLRYVRKIVLDRSGKVDIVDFLSKALLLQNLSLDGWCAELQVATFEMYQAITINRIRWRSTDGIINSSCHTNFLLHHVLGGYGLEGDYAHGSSGNQIDVSQQEVACKKTTSTVTATTFGHVYNHQGKCATTVCSSDLVGNDRGLIKADHRF